MVCELSLGARVYPAGAVIEVPVEQGSALVALGLAVPDRAQVETATAPATEFAVTRKEKGGKFHDDQVTIS